MWMHKGGKKRVVTLVGFSIMAQEFTYRIMMFY